jgi:adenylate cyclase
MTASTEVRERQLAIVLVDLARFTRAVAGLGLSELVGVVDAFYRAAGTAVAAQGGRVVKFVGDGCLAVFEPDDVISALDAVDALRAEVRSIGAARGLDMDLGANVHLATVAEAELGLDGTFDVIGMGVVHAFRMGSGAGTRISEPVYRRLPSGRRTPWRKHQPPATYVLEAE